LKQVQTQADFQQLKAEVISKSSDAVFAGLSENQHFESIGEAKDLQENARDYLDTIQKLKD